MAHDTATARLRATTYVGLNRKSASYLASLFSPIRLWRTAARVDSNACKDVRPWKRRRPGVAHWTTPTSTYEQSIHKPRSWDRAALASLTILSGKQPESAGVP
ncbi:hypothetical protein ACLB1E_34055 [Escherichia coli]